MLNDSIKSIIWRQPYKALSLSLSLDHEREEICTMLALGFHKHFRNWWLDLSDRYRARSGHTTGLGLFAKFNNCKGARSWRFKSWKESLDAARQPRPSLTYDFFHSALRPFIADVLRGTHARPSTLHSLISRRFHRIPPRPSREG